MAQPSLADLPCEVLVQVLRPLSLQDRCRAAKACRALQRAADGVLASSSYVDLKAGSAVLDSSGFICLCSRLSGGCLKRMELDCWHLEDASLEHVPRSVTEITLSGCDHHSDALIAGLAKRLGPGLTKFAFSGFGGPITELPFANLAAACRGLVSFALDSGQSIDSNQIVRCVASSCPKLEELCTYDLTQETLWHLRRCSIRLRCLRLKRRHLGYVTVTDSALAEILLLGPDLEELQLIDKIEATL